jgi:hypothetical protein
MAISYNTSVVRDGLVLYLDAANPKSYPGTGTTWFDLSGNDNNVTLFNGVAYDSTTKSFLFDGVNDYARTVNTINFSGTNKVTAIFLLQAQTYPMTAGFRVIYELSTNFNSIVNTFIATYADNSLSQNNEVFSSNRGNSSYNIAVYNKTILNDLNWHNFASIHDTSEVLKENLIYNNSSLGLEIQNPATGFSGNNTNNFASGEHLFFGSRGGSTGFSNFKVASIMFYNRRLTEQELKTNFNATRGRYGI